MIGDYMEMMGATQKSNRKAEERFGKRNGK